MTKPDFAALISARYPGLAEDVVRACARDLSQAYEAGRLDGLDRAAEIADGEKYAKHIHETWAEGCNDACDDIAAAIRAAKEADDD